MTDTELEDRVRATLLAVAEGTPLDAPAAARRRRMPPRLLTVAATVAVLAGAVAVVARIEAQDPKTRVVAPLDGPHASQLPAGFDIVTAAPLFASDGDANTVAVAYARDRFPDYPNPGIRLDPAVVDGSHATVRWHTDITSGDVALRLLGSTWSVVAATTDDVYLGGISLEDEHVRGAVTTSNENALQVTVGERRIGPRAAPIVLDAGAPDRSVVVRASLVGGSLLSISEVRLEPAATTRTVLGGGDGWDLVASDEPTGRWVSLRAADLDGTFALQTDGDFDSLFTSLGPCCRVRGRVLVVGALRRDATGMQVVLADQRTSAAQAITDPVTGVQYAVVAVPEADIAADPRARVQVNLADGTVQDAGVPLDLSVIGG